MATGGVGMGNKDRQGGSVKHYSSLGSSKLESARALKMESSGGLLSPRAAEAAVRGSGSGRERPRRRGFGSDKESIDGTVRAVDAVVIETKNLL